MLRVTLLAFACLTASGCGVSTTSTSSFKVRMFGIHSPPAGADGNSAPRSQTYLFNGVTLTDSAGKAISLYTGDPKTLKIIDRGQLVFSNANMTEHNGTTYVSALIQFDPTIVVTSKSGTSSTLALSSGDLQLDDSYVVTKNKEQVLTIKIAWGETVNIADDGTETMTPPTFTLKYEAAH